jgi:DNA-binding NarL/FixJ family response regulator
MDARWTAMKARILIVDDHEVVREGLKTLLRKSRPEWEVCGEAADGEQAIQMVGDLKPDLVVLDITMPGISGLEASSRIAELGLGCPVLIFTMHDSERLGIEVRHARAQGFVLKSQAVRDLVLAIDTLLAGGSFFGGPTSVQTPEKHESNPRKLHGRASSARSSLSLVPHFLPA